MNRRRAAAAPIPPPERPGWTLMDGKFVAKDPDPDSEIRKEREETIARLGRKMQRTGNPLYAWDAIRMCHHKNYPMPYPDWVREYLNGAAQNLIALTEERNPLTYPERRADESAEAHRARWEAWKAQTITDADALRLAPQVLGLVRKGRNVFRLFRIARATDIASVRHDLQVAGESRDVIAEEMKTRSISEETAKRRLALGRRRLGRSVSIRSREKPPA